LYLAERVLESTGIDMADEIEQYQLSEADDAVLGAERQRLIETVLAQLGASGNGAESVEDDLSPEP
jgi:hypothetical protein